MSPVNGIDRTLERLEGCNLVLDLVELVLSFDAVHRVVERLEVCQSPLDVLEMVAVFNAVYRPAQSLDVVKILLDLGKLVISVDLNLACKQELSEVLPGCKTF